ncbi:MAG: hypothetical protein RL288_990, partial [Actinomycetota bacterium]
DSLDSAQVLEGEPAYPQSISIAVVADAMLGFDKEIVKKFPLNWVQPNLLKRYRRKAIWILKRVNKKL